MKRYLICSLSVLVFASCGEKKTAPPKPAPEKSDALIIGDPIDCGLDSLLIFPLGSSYSPEIIGSNANQEVSENTPVMLNGTVSTESVGFSQNRALTKYDRRADEEFVNKNAENYDIRNLLFYDMNTQKSYPLVLDSLHILSFALHREFERDMIFYRVVKKDLNKDGKYDNLDPVMLYISDLNGENFTQITPEDEQFIDYTFYAATNTILIKTVIDSDKNLKFLTDDETSFSSMKIMEPAKAKEIFSKDLKNSLRSYLK